MKAVKKKKSIARKSILRIIALGVFILIGVSCVVGYVFYRSMLKVYSQMAYTFAETAGLKVGCNETKELIKRPDLVNLLVNFPTIKNDMDLKDDDLDLLNYWFEADMFLYDAVRLQDNIVRFQVAVPGEVGVTLLWNEDGEALKEKEIRRPYREGEKEKIDEFRAKTYVDILDEEEEERIDMTVSYEDGKTIGSSIFPVFDESGNNIIAYSELDISITGVQRGILQLTLVIAGIILIIMVIGLIIYFRRAKKEIINPVVRLQRASSDAVDKIREGDPVFELDIHTGDELEDLARSFEDMEKSLVAYIDENAAITSERERIAAELNLAATIQADMLIDRFPAFPERSDFDIFASMDPAKEVGGDFYDFFFVDDDVLALVVADVSGKGIPASLFMMRSMLLIENYAMKDRSPASILREVNLQLCNNNDSQMFVTVWLGILDLKTGLLVASNAGHEYPVIKRPGKPFELFKDKHGFVLGGMKKMIPKEYEIQLEPGTKLVLYTDGATEAKNPKGEMIRTEGFLDVVNQAPDDTPETLLTNVAGEIRRFIGDAEQFDDLTLMSLFYYGRCRR